MWNGFDLRCSEKCTDIFTELEMVKVGGSNIIGLQKWVGPVPPTYNGSDAHVQMNWTVKFDIEGCMLIFVSPVWVIRSLIKSTNMTICSVTLVGETLRNTLHVPFIGSCETMASDGRFVWVGQSGICVSTGRNLTFLFCGKIWSFFSSEIRKSKCLGHIFLMLFRSEQNA